MTDNCERSGGDGGCPEARGGSGGGRGGYAADVLSPEMPPPDLAGTALIPDELERAAALVERRANESPDAVPAVVEVAETECGWWLLAELTTGAAAEDAGDPPAREPEAELVPRDALVESIARHTGRSEGEVFRTLHTRLLPTLLVTDLVEHAESVASPPTYAAAVRLRTADREFVAAVLLLVAAAAGLEVEREDLATFEYGRDVLCDPVERFSAVVRRVREASRRAERRSSVGREASFSF